MSTSILLKNPHVSRYLLGLALAAIEVAFSRDQRVLWDFVRLLKLAPATIQSFIEKPVVKGIAA